MVTEEVLRTWMLENNGAILKDQEHEGVFSGYITFTPDRAEQALGNNTSNRKPGKNGQIPMLVEVLQNNLWDDNVSKINFDKECVLSDGQNRLMSCVQANVPIRLLVTFGVEKSTQFKTDRRGSRTLSNDIEIAKFPNTNRLAAMTRVVFFRQNGKTVKSLITKSRQFIGMADEILYRFFEENTDYIQEKNKVVLSAVSAVSHLKIPTPIMNVLAYEFDIIDADDARTFWDRLGSGIKNGDDDPVWLLHMRLINSLKKNTSTIPSPILSALIIKAWNFYEQGESVYQLKYASGGAHPEPFPKIYNPYTETEIE